LKLLVIISLILAVATSGVAWVVRYIQSLLKTPSRVTVVSIDPGAGTIRTIERHWPLLESLGFESIGTYRVPEIRGLVITAFAQNFQGVCSVLYEHPLAGTFADMFALNENDESLTVSSAPAGEELDQPPGHEKIIDSSLELREMYDLTLNRRPEGPFKRFTSENFAGEFEKAYAKEMDWRINRGGVTEEEVRRSAEKIGITSEKNIQKATEQLQQEYAEKKEELAREPETW